MNIDKHLFIYPNGARGDFLASLLIGDILTSSFQNAWILSPGTHPYWHHKLHRMGDAWNSRGPIDVESFDHYDHIIRIKLEDHIDCENCLKLATIKMVDRNFTPAIDLYTTYEQTFSLLDDKFDAIVSFKDLFDIDKLKILFVKYRHRSMTDVEEQRVIYNIKLNLDLLRS